MVMTTASRDDTTLIISYWKNGNLSIIFFFNMVKVEGHLAGGSEGPTDKRKENTSQVPYLFGNKNNSGERKK